MMKTVIIVKLFTIELIHIFFIHHQFVLFLVKSQTEEQEVDRNLKRKSNKFSFEIKCRKLAKKKERKLCDEIN